RRTGTQQTPEQNRMDIPQAKSQRHPAIDVIQGPPLAHSCNREWWSRAIYGVDFIWPAASLSRDRCVQEGLPAIYRTGPYINVVARHAGNYRGVLGKLNERTFASGDGLDPLGGDRRSRRVRSVARSRAGYTPDRWLRDFLRALFRPHVVYLAATEKKKPQ